VTKLSGLTGQLQPCNNHLLFQTRVLTQFYCPVFSAARHQKNHKAAIWASLYSEVNST
jgi:hypothetical protein